MTSKSKKNKKKSAWRKAWSVLWWSVNVLMFIVHLMSAFGGHVRPEASGFVSASSMAFPIVILASFSLLVADLVVMRKTAVVPALAIVASIKPILLICPLNLTSSIDNDERQRSFSLMTYNVYNFLNKQGDYPDDTNPTLSFILKEDPDIVALQECEYLSYYKKAHVYSAQSDSIKARYPYRFIGETDGQSILSKFPITDLNIGEINDGKSRICAHRVAIGSRSIVLINVHLYSIQLTDDDKGTYLNLTHGEAKGNIRKARANLMVKLSAALRRHADECRDIRRGVDSWLSTADNIIICGDLNDTPASHAYYILRGDDFGDAYADTAFGPTITYNEKRFFFRIDHVFYRGKIKPRKIIRGDVRYSDHYPLTTTFVFE